MNAVENHIYVIFGASGDLTKRKLVPAIYSLYLQNMLPEKFVLLGVSRTKFSDSAFRENMKEAIKAFSESIDETKIDPFLQKLFYTTIDFGSVASYEKLKTKIEALGKSHDLGGKALFYLSTPPSLYSVIPTNLAAVGLNKEDNGWKRIIIEKPFGYNLQSALQLKEALLKHWSEEQIYRIDHYLGKETVQNLLVTRFSNGIFEPLWNRNYVDHIEITSAESIGVESRGGYYESSGALCDMVQNHLLQMVGLVAMESPSSLEPVAVRHEILKVFQSLRPIKKEDVRKAAIRGQYISSTIKGEKVAGYREEEGVKPQSTTETYAAIKFYIDNWRWGGVPFYIRTGKRLPTRVTEIVIHFKQTPHFLFAQTSANRACNQLVIRIQPDEGILLKFGMKTPGTGFDVQNVNMDFHYSELSHQRIQPAYERLLYDTIKGDATLFARTEEVLEAWKFLAPIMESWEADQNIPLFGYPAGSWGPENADDLIDNKNFTWRYPCKNLTDDGLYCEL